MSRLIEPRGGKLVDLMVHEDEARELKARAVEFKNVFLSSAEEFDLELLLTGAYSPLQGFMTREDYEGVLSEARLSSGFIWPIPITLGVGAELAKTIAPGEQVALRNQEGLMLAVLEVQDLWQPDKRREARDVFQSDDHRHPGVARLMEAKGSYYIGGRVRGISLPIHHDYKVLRRTPREMRNWFKKAGWKKVLAFQTRRPLHNAHKAATLKAAHELSANILLHPIVGPTSPGDIEYYARIRCYQALIKSYPPDTAVLNLLPMAMRMAGPREALLQAIINKNYGCTHFMVTPNHADPFTATSHPPYYPQYSALDFLKAHEDDIGIFSVPFEPMVYVEELGQYLREDECPRECTPKRLSATELRRRLEFGLEIPEWFSPREVVKELRRAYPPRSKQGFTIFFTGLSGAGKSTLARILYTRFLEMGQRPVTLLDGDIVRRHLSSELGYSREHRHMNVIRIGFVASEITKNRGIAICAPIAPYERSRRYNRELISKYGGYIEVYVATPLEVCMKRDRKGLYALALSGKKKGVTGIDDPYEPPMDPEVVIDTTDMDPEEAVQEILSYLKKTGYLGGPSIMYNIKNGLIRSNPW